MYHDNDKQYNKSQPFSNSIPSCNYVHVSNLYIISNFQMGWLNSFYLQSVKLRVEACDSTIWGKTTFTFLYISITQDV